MFKSFVFYLVLFVFSAIIDIKNIARVNVEKKIVALTFDDGPSLYTLKLLEILKKHDVKSTFFQVGMHIETYPDILKKVMEDGHEVGNHSWSHVDLSKQSAEVILAEITKTDSLIEKLGYTGNILFRAPYGKTSPIVIDVLDSLGKENILWDVWAPDWKNPGVDLIVDTIVSMVKPGSIILLHDACIHGVCKGPGANRSEMIAAVDKIITQLTLLGYTFLTVNQLLSEANPFM